MADRRFEHCIQIGGGGTRLWDRLSEFRYTDLDTINRKTTCIICIFKPDRCWDRLFTFHRFFGTDFLYEIVNFDLKNNIIPHCSMLTSVFDKFQSDQPITYANLTGWLRYVFEASNCQTMKLFKCLYIC